MTDLIPQGTHEWLMSRVGLTTASRVHDVVAQTKSGPAASRKNYLAEKVTEILTGQPYPTFQTGPMKWGIDTEPQALAAVEFVHDTPVERVGFIRHPTLEAGASPDGLLKTDGMVQTKCPNTATHIEQIQYGTIAKRHLDQMQLEMCCANRMWSLFVSFDPRLPPPYDYWEKVVERDQKRINFLEEQIAIFMREVHATIKLLKEKVHERKAQ